MEGSFFDDVLDVVRGFVADVPGRVQGSAHRRGLKLWFDDATREHYEAQLIRVDGAVVLEVGFHSEHPKVEANEAVLARFGAAEKAWRKQLGKEPVAGDFHGDRPWRRVSEIWPAPEPDDVDAVIEVAARLAEYAHALEPLRRSAR